MEVKAPAKLNLTLDVLGTRPDGYHDMRMVMQSVSLCDTLSVDISTQGISLASKSRYLPAPQKNLAFLAAERFFEAVGGEIRAHITMEKRIPVCAGMAGGSADAAAVLHALNRLTGVALPVERLCAIGAQVGSDVPFCVLGGTALAEGRGERLTPLRPLPSCWAVIVKPAFSISTPELFSRIDGRKIRLRPDTAGMLDAIERRDLPAIGRRVFNVFEDVLEPAQRRQIDEIKAELHTCGALGAAMTGSGSAVFGLFDSEQAARAAHAALQNKFDAVFLEKTIQ